MATVAIHSSLSAAVSRSEKAEHAKRSQSEKSANTRERILESTLDCLVELGYARTTTVEVTERSGLSRGALLHHFPSKAELVTAAAEYLVEKRVSEFIDSISAMPPAADVVGTAIDLLWASFSSDSSYAVLELTVAARTDRELYALLQPLVERYETVIAENAKALFVGYAPNEKVFEFARRLIYYLMHGLAVTRILRQDDREVQLILTAIKRQAILDAQSVLGSKPDETPG